MLSARAIFLDVHLSTAVHLRMRRATPSTQEGRVDHVVSDYEKRERVWRYWVGVTEFLWPIIDHKYVRTANLLKVWLQCHFHDFPVNRTPVRTYLNTYWLADSATPTQCLVATVTLLHPKMQLRVPRKYNNIIRRPEDALDIQYELIFVNGMVY